MPSQQIGQVGNPGVMTTSNWVKIGCTPLVHEWFGCGEWNRGMVAKGAFLKLLLRCSTLVGQKVGWSEKGGGSMDPCLDSMCLGELTWPWNGNPKTLYPNCIIITRVIGDIFIFHLAQLGVN